MYIKEIVRSFDETISLKANKSSFQVMREEFERKYIHIYNWETI